MLSIPSQKSSKRTISVPGDGGDEMEAFGSKHRGSQIGVRGIGTWLRILRPARLLSKLDPNKFGRSLGISACAVPVTQAVVCGKITDVAG